MLDIILFISNTFLWGIKPFLYKFFFNKIGFFNSIILRYIFSGVIALLLLMYSNNDLIEKISQNSNYIISGFLLAGLSVISSLIYYFLLNKYNVNFVSIIISPISILLTALIGHFLFKEYLTLQMWIGMLLIIIGLFIFISGKK